MFEDALAHEEKVTERIHELASLALEIKDHATYNFLQWFIAEQVEEEETATDMVQKFRMAGEHPAGLYQLDKELAARVFTPPAPLVAAGRCGRRLRRRRRGSERPDHERQGFTSRRGASR